MLLTTSDDKTAAIWSVSYGFSCSLASYATLQRHTNHVSGGAFFGDDWTVITASLDGTLRIWSSIGSVQTANYECGLVCHWFVYSYFCFSLLLMQVCSLSYHDESGNIALGRSDGQVELWQTADVDIAPTFQAPPQATFAPTPKAAPLPAFGFQSAFGSTRQAAPQPDFGFPQAVSQPAFRNHPGLTPPSKVAPPFQPARQAPLPDHACVRERLAAAQAQVKDIQTSLEKADSGLRQQMSREQELKRSIADLQGKCTHTYLHGSILRLHC